MEGHPFNGENGMKEEDIVSPLLPPFVYDAAVEKQKQFVAERMRKKYPVPAANDVLFGEDNVQPELEVRQVPPLPYMDRDDDELVRDEKDGKWVMKKYKD